MTTRLFHRVFEKEPLVSRSNKTGQSLAFYHYRVALSVRVVTQLCSLSKLILSLFFLPLLIGFVGCESSSSVTSNSPDTSTPEDASEPVEMAKAIIEVSEDQVKEAEMKYRLASQLLQFAGPIDDLSPESKNVRWLAADLIQTAVELNPNEFKYYRDLFMTYMVFQEPVRAFDGIEPATTAPELANEVAEFQSLVFGALEFASLIENDS